MRKTCCAFAVVALVSGCVASPSRTPTDMRDSGRKESIEVDRPYAAVADAIGGGAKRCLDGKRLLTHTTYSNGDFSEFERTYHITVLPHTGRTEIYLQKTSVAHRTNVIKLSTPPPNGYYYMVIDVTQLAPKKTRVELYRRSGYEKVTGEAVKNWAEGSDMSCPDLTKD